MTPGLTRRLGTADAVVVGLSAMIGAGVFAAFAPAAAAAGSWLPVALALAGLVAYCNAISSARLAALYPSSGGTYVYGRERLGDLWGFSAGWGFVVGKTASCAAMALTFGAYVAPGHEKVFAVLAVAALTGLNLAGVQKSMPAARVIVAVVIVVLLAVVTAGMTGGGRSGGGTVPVDAWGVLQGAGLLFFAFAGYARIATLGEEVREPQRTIPRAVPIALGVTLVLYALVAFAVLGTLGPAQLAGSAAPLADTVTAAGASWLSGVVRAGAALATFGALLALILGVSRTTFAMSRGRHFPAVFDAVSERHGVPHRAELAVGVAVMVLVLLVDLRGAIGFSSFGVLVYYAIANASALTLGRRAVPAVGLAGCLLLAATLPRASVLAGLVVFAVGALVWAAGRPRHGRAAPPSRQAR
ncbi:APC family permease [Actinoplanes sp. NPDC049548]|uniref:APC family permease n=1 Tax=Actinoplanes sp. NPDC049548 TaxID=3155152 RepID=UPI00343689AA